MEQRKTIEDKEDKLIEATRTVRQIDELLDIEKATNGGYLNEDNKDYWDRLMVTADDLKRKLTKLVAKINDSL